MIIFRIPPNKKAYKAFKHIKMCQAVCIRKLRSHIDHPSLQCCSAMNNSLIHDHLTSKLYPDETEMI
jgi:hypothetical protein